MQATLEATDVIPAALGPLAMGAIIPDPGLLFVLDLEDEEPRRSEDDLDEILALRCASL